MGSVVISHLIGTVALIVLFGIVATNFTIHYSLLQLEVLVYNLQEVSEYVSSEISDMVSLSYLSTGDQLIFKELEVPKNVGGKAYDLQITSSEGLLKVVANSSASVYGEALLPWSLAGNIGIFNGTQPGGRILARPKVSSASEETLVVWCLKEGQKIVFGLGYMEEG